jgi:hypothetical protein
MNNRIMGVGTIMALSFLLFWGGFKFFNYQDRGPLESDSFINYVIPKLKQFIPKFSLWNRKFIDRRKLAPKIPQNPTKTLVAVPGVKPPAKPIAVAKPKPTVTPLPSSTPTVSAKPELSTSVALEESPLDVIDPAQTNPFIGGGAAGKFAIPESSSPETLIGDWKMRIINSPNKETMNDFIDHFQTGKVAKEVYYQVLTELIQDSSPDIQRLALYSLSATPSLDSLSILMSNRDYISVESQDMLRLALDSYARPERLKLLNSALKSGNSRLVLGTMPLVVKIGSKMTLWSADYSSLSGDRASRGPTTRVPKSGLVEIFQTLQNLENSSDNLISQAARNTLNQLNYNPSTASSRE